ncbi:MAG: sigma-70 family RNA polymerase sigma factor [Polyangiaceae bacterium]
MQDDTTPPDSPSVDDDPRRAASADVVSALVENHRAFLHFLEKRVGRRDLAEDILQEAFARGIARVQTLEKDESAVAWFYRTLRNAVIDQHRRRGAEERALASFADELAHHQEAEEELRGQVCQCVARLATTLKPEYAEALERIEVQGASVKAYAEERGISANNAAVRVFRAREALRKQVVASCGTCATHGCLDCTCEEKAGAHGCGSSPS